MSTIRKVLTASVVGLTFVAPAIEATRAKPAPTPVRFESQADVPLPRFTSVELRGGGKAVLRHGPLQRVTLLKGSPEITSVTVAVGERLVIGKYGDKCSRGYELEIEIVTPDIDGIAVADGGTIETQGNFPRQAEITLDVSNGGTIDMRSMMVDKVIANVAQGGSIFTKPQSVMFASVLSGGRISYWGDARVISSIQAGGTVTRGPAAEADKPLSDPGQRPHILPISSIPPTAAPHPIQPKRSSNSGH